MCNVYMQKPTQETLDVGPTLVYCWANVVDSGPTVNQRWAKISCLLCSENSDFFHLKYPATNMAYLSKLII